MFKVYKLTWNQSGEFYFGFTSRSMEDRLEEHRTSGNDAVRRAFQQYGSPIVGSLGEYPTEAKAREVERSWIDANKHNPKCLNES